MKMRTGQTVVALMALSALACAADIATHTSPTERAIRLGHGETIVSTSTTLKPAAPSTLGPVVGVASAPHPQPRLVGFSPLLAITTSDARQNADIQWEHVYAWDFVGNGLAGPPATNFVIGILDSGSDVDLAAGSSAAALGMSTHITGNTIPIGGAGGTVNADITLPLGYFAAGLDAVSLGGVLDTNALMGHWNVAAVAAPPIECDNGEVITAVVGNPFIYQFNHVIRVDTPVKRTVNNVSYQSPQVDIREKSEPLPSYSRLVPLELGGLAPVATASYYGDFEDFRTPLTPTLLALTPVSFPTGGAFFTEISVREGPAGPDNPPITLRMLVDSGAQSSVLSPNAAAQLSLSLEGDFAIDVCGVGGLEQDVPGYYLDYVRIAALGGALEFSNAPFVLLDLQSPEGGPLDGILGMNFFYNRNVILETSLDTSSFLHVSEPIAIPYGDNDVDFDVDLSDELFFATCMTPTGVDGTLPECRHLDKDMDGDVDMRDFANLQSCFSGDGNTADPNCGCW